MERLVEHVLTFAALCLALSRAYHGDFASLAVLVIMLTLYARE